MLPAWSTSEEPRSTRSTLVPIRPLISLAAAAERLASERTSEATTAKPRPCSPARAASTAAFSARMLVWKAMPSMVPMMSPILREASLMPFIVSTTWPTTAPPLTATAEASVAICLASRALSELCLTVESSSSIDEAVSSSALAWLSVRADRSWLPWAISALAVATPSEPARTLCTTAARPSFISTRSRSRAAISSRPLIWISTPRLPAAISPVNWLACASARVMPLTRNQPTITAPSTPQAIARMAMPRIVSKRATAAWYSVLPTSSCNWIRASISALAAAQRAGVAPLAICLAWSKSPACRAASVGRSAPLTYSPRFSVKRLAIAVSSGVR